MITSQATQEAITELDAVLALLEAKLPANPRAEENQRLERKLQRDLAAYFRDLEQAIDYSRLEMIYLGHVEQG